MSKIKLCILVLVSLASVKSHAGKCPSADESNFLYMYAVEMLGPPIGCRFDATSAKGTELQFGVQTYRFKNAAKLSIEMSPPETMVATLDVPSGLNEKESIERLKAGTKAKGLAIDFEKLDSSSKVGVSQTYWDPDTGLNARVFLRFTKKKLTTIGYGLAL